MTTFLTSILAAVLAVALSREHRIRRAFQDLAARLLDRLRQTSGLTGEPHTAPRKSSSHRRRS